MPLRYLIDENLRGTLAVTVVRHATKLGLELDILQIGDVGAPQRGTTDPEILAWGESSNRIIITRDHQTMPTHLANHLAAGRYSPGVIILRHRTLIAITEFIVLAAFVTDAVEWQNRITYVP